MASERQLVIIGGGISSRRRGHGAALDGEHQRVRHLRPVAALDLHDAVELLAGHPADSDALRHGKRTRICPSDRLIHRVRDGAVGAGPLAPPALELAAGVARVLGTDPLGLVLRGSDLIVHPHRPRVARLGVPLDVRLVVHVPHVIVFLSNFSRQHPLAGGVLREVAPRGRREHMAAFRAGPVSRVDDGVALGTGLRGGVSSAALAGFPRLYHVQRPVPHDVAPIVQNEAVRLASAGGEARPASGHLQKQSCRLRRSHQNHAVRVRGVEAGRQHRAVRKVLERLHRRPEEVGGNLLAAEPRDDLGAESRGRLARDHGALLARVPRDGLRDVLAVRHGRAEDEDGLPLTGQYCDLGAGGVHQLLVVHSGGQFVLDEFARPRVDGRQVGLGAPRAGHQRREVSLRDHLLEASLVAYFVEQVLGFADRASLQPERRGRQADEADVRVDDLHVLEEGAVHALAVWGDEVRLVDAYQIERAEVAGLAVHALYARHDDGLPGVAGVEPGGIDADLQLGAEPPHLVGVLFQELLHMGEDEDAASPEGHRVRGDLRQHQALARACRKDHAGIGVLCSEVLIDRIDGLLLVWSQVHCHSSASSSSGQSSGARPKFRISTAVSATMRSYLSRMIFILLQMSSGSSPRIKKKHTRRWSSLVMVSRYWRTSSARASRLLLSILLYPHDRQPVGGLRRFLRHRQFPYQGIVLVHPRAGERVQRTLERVVHVPAAVVGRVEVEADLHRLRERRAARLPGDRRHRLPVPPPVLRDEDARADMAVVVVHRGRPGQGKRHLHSLCSVL